MCVKRLKARKHSPSTRILNLSKTLHSMRKVTIALMRGNDDQHLVKFILRRFEFLVQALDFCDSNSFLKENNVSARMTCVCLGVCDGGNYHGKS